MGLLRRLFGGDRNGHAATPGTPATAGGKDAWPSVADIDAEERAREAELSRFDRERVDDLIQRQQRYADRSWTPPRQGGERRAEDEDRTD